MVYGLGAAMNVALEMCLELNERWDDKLILDVTTDTVELMDEYIPEIDGVEAKVETRLNSSVRIIITRKKK